MKKTDLNRNWEFYEAEEGNAFVFEAKESQNVDLPHDYIITKPRNPNAVCGSDTGYFGEGGGVYRKTIDVLPEWEDKVVLLDIDGAAMLGEVAVNREVLSVHPNGYMPHIVDITGALRFDGRKNVIKIITQCRHASSRWYTGGGLYRSVSLWVGNKLHIKPWDIFVTTPEVTQQAAVIHIKYLLSEEPDNYSDRVFRVIIRILDAERKVVAEKETENRREAALLLSNPNFWEPDSPYLYCYQVTVMLGGQVMDISEDYFGIRTITVDAENGFRLNGKPIKLKGGCLHHDNGLLGACAYEQAEERKIRILKEAGYNTVRISHNPPSLAMLRICDRLGMLLMDEAFDAWKLGKRPMDYHLYFEEWWERDIAAMVKRDRNHPCVITYSIGNEINESNGKNQGALWAKRLAEAVRRYDSTRFVTAGVCGVFPDLDEGIAYNNIDANLDTAGRALFGEKTEEYCKPLDIVGMNYLYDIYEDIHRQFPGRIILGTESHAYYTWDSWMEVEKHPYVIGDCIWAAMDYLGEVGGGRVKWDTDEKPQELWNAPYPWRTSWQSDFDLTGEARPQSVYRQIMWGKKDLCGIFTTHPMHYGHQFYGTGWHWPDVHATWTFPKEYEGCPVKVEVYGAGDEAEFLLNGESLGSAPFEKNVAVMDVPYRRGKLQAVVRRKGEPLCAAELESTGACRTLELEIEEDKGVPQSLVYLRVYALDEERRRVMEEEGEISVSVGEAGKLLAVGSGNPCTEDRIGTNRCHLFQGTAIIIVKRLSENPFSLSVTLGEITCERQIGSGRERSGEDAAI